MRLLLAFLLLTAAAPAAAQQPQWRAAPEQDVLMFPYGYEPAPIRLAAGRPVKLRFINQGQTDFSFSAPRFFRAARMRAGDAAAINDGAVRLAPGERRTIALVPAAGRYRARSTNLAHRLRGMSAAIIVE